MSPKYLLINSDPRECEWCGQYVNEKYAYRCAERTPLQTVGPVLFCSEDCREDWRHYGEHR